MKTLKEIEEEFDKEIENNPKWSERFEGGEGVNDEAIKSFLKETINKLLDEVIGKKEPTTFQNTPKDIDSHKHIIGMKDGYNQKRQEIIEFKEEFNK